MSSLIRIRTFSPVLQYTLPINVMCLSIFSHCKITRDSGNKLLWNRKISGNNKHAYMVICLYHIPAYASIKSYLVCNLNYYN